MKKLRRIGSINVREYLLGSDGGAGIEIGVVQKVAKEIASSIISRPAVVGPKVKLDYGSIEEDSGDESLVVVKETPKPAPEEAEVMSGFAVTTRGTWGSRRYCYFSPSGLRGRFFSGGQRLFGVGALFGCVYEQGGAGGCGPGLGVRS